MAANFYSDLAFVLGEEGGISNLTGDAGGYTYKGISQVKNSTWAGWQIIKDLAQAGSGSLSQDKLLQKAVDDFYFATWIDLRCNALLSQFLSLCVFDTAVNCGNIRSIRLLQTALNCMNLRGKRWADIAVTGVIDSSTTVSLIVAEKRQTDIGFALLAARGRHYLDCLADGTDLLGQHANNESFAGGWFNRLARLYGKGLQERVGL